MGLVLLSHSERIDSFIIGYVVPPCFVQGGIFLQKKSRRPDWPAGTQLWGSAQQHITDQHYAKADQQGIGGAALAAVGMGLGNHFIADYI